MINIKNKDNYVIYTLIEDDKEIGYIETIPNLDILEITDVLIYPEYRGKGKSKELLSFVINSNNDKEKILLEVSVNNKVAISLYEKFGFKTINIRKKYYKDLSDALIMEVNMKDVYILAIESSCDETSVSIVKNGCEDIATTINSQIDIHKEYGGVVPEVASRKHLENITMVIDETLQKANMKLEDMDAFACTYAPGLIGGLLVGLECAKTLSLIYEKPFIKVNHMMGHIYANNIGNDLKYPLIALVVSGGHTDLILMKGERDFEYIGRTLDDAIGESYDKVARILGIPYPGGPNVEKLALQGEFTYKMPVLMNDDSYNFSFSGIKSHLNNLVHNEEQRGHEINREDLACSFQTTVTDLLVSKTRKALVDFNVKTLIVAGGVSSNNYIRSRLSDMCEKIDVEIKVPDKKYCTDNATMIGAAAYVLYKDNEFATLDTNAKSIESL